MSIFKLIKEIVDELDDMSNKDFIPPAARPDITQTNFKVRQNNVNYSDNGNKIATEDFDRIDLHRGNGMECQFSANNGSHSAVNTAAEVIPGVSVPAPQPNKIIDLLRHNAADAIIVNEILSKPLALRDKK